MISRRYLLIFLAIFIFVILNPVSSQQSPCNLDAKLINQDPYPVIPGERLKVVFQLEGTDDVRCGLVTFQLLEEFPFSLESDMNALQQIQSGTYVSSSFPSFWLVPYNVIVDSAAIDGETPIKVTYNGKDLGARTEEFNITIENLLGDFEVSIKDYEAVTNTLTFEILNIGEADVEALTVEIPKQENIEIKGTKRNIIGSLDSKEDSTFSFEAIPKNGEIMLTIFYTDKINERRTLEKTVVYDSAYFTERARDKTGRSVSFYLLIGLIVLEAAYLLYRGWKKRKARHKLHHLHHQHH